MGQIQGTSLHNFKLHPSQIWQLALLFSDLLPAVKSFRLADLASRTVSFRLTYCDVPSHQHPICP
jgi:hypothetical protein